MKKTTTFELTQRLMMSDFSNEIFLFPDTFERPFIKQIKRRNPNNLLILRMNCYFVHLSNGITSSNAPKNHIDI
jgi:hypothetical protein